MAAFWPIDLFIFEIRLEMNICFLSKFLVLWVESKITCQIRKYYQRCNHNWLHLHYAFSLSTIFYINMSVYNSQIDKKKLRYDCNRNLKYIFDAEERVQWKQLGSFCICVLSFYPLWAGHGSSVRNVESPMRCHLWLMEYRSMFHSVMPTFNHSSSLQKYLCHLYDFHAQSSHKTMYIVYCKQPRTAEEMIFIPCLNLCKTGLDLSVW